MKLENQLTTLETSKKLKELGVKQESLYWWYQVYAESISMKDAEEGKKVKMKWILEPLNRSGNAEISAYTVAELGEMLVDIYRERIEQMDFVNEDELSKEGKNRLNKK